MKIPKNALDRSAFYDDVLRKCFVSQQDRIGQYSTLRSYYLFGSPNQTQARYNKIYPVIDQLASFLFAAETTKFSAVPDSSVAKVEQKRAPAVAKAVLEEWHRGNGDLVFGDAVQWGLVYASAFIKVIPNRGTNYYIVEPQRMGVFREDTPYLERQEAIAMEYWMTESEVKTRLHAHPRKDEILKNATAGESVPQEFPAAVNRIILSQSSPNMIGQANVLEGDNLYMPAVGEPLIRFTELWIWDDDIEAYRCVTQCSPGITVYDREGKELFVKGEHPFVQVCPMPLYNYLWGDSMVSKLSTLQDWREKRMLQISDVLGRQLKPPGAAIGVMGITEEKWRAMNTEDGFFTSPDPMGKIERYVPELPNDTFSEIKQLDEMFNEISSISHIMSGKGESGVRSNAQASTLARMGSSRIKKRALVIEDALERVAYLTARCMQEYNDDKYQDEDGVPFIMEQFTRDFQIKVDAHSNSPIFVEDQVNMAFDLLKMGAIDREMLLELVSPPMKDRLIRRLKEVMEPAEAKAKDEEKAAAMQQQQMRLVKGGG